MHKQFQLLVLSALVWLPALAHADDKPLYTTGISLGMNQYKEPGIMQLEGPEVGFHLRTSAVPQSWNFQLESDILLGQQTYTSSQSGHLDRVRNLETRWRAMTPIFGSPYSSEGFSTGLAIHTLWNDLRGTTNTNHAGYERVAAQVWLPLRWTDGQGWEFDTGWLLHGRHTSKLSQVSSSYSDITNTQRRGEYVQASVKLALGEHTLTPFVRYTHLADSDIVSMAGDRWLEPNSQRWQIGAIWELR